MSYRRTLIFLLTFTALAGFFYFYEIRGGEARKEAEEKADRFFSFEPEEVTAISVKKPDLSVQARKEEDKWNITEPVNAPADQRTVEQMVKALSELKYRRDLGAQSDLGPFGLSEPAAEIEITREDEEVGKLIIGSSTPDGSNLYVKTAAGPEVFTVPKSAGEKVNLSLFEMRDKRLFDFLPSEVKLLTVMRDGRTYKFETRPDDEWLMVSPEEHHADGAKIRSFLDSVRFSRIKRFVEEDAADMKPYGLEDPGARVEISLADSLKILWFGSKTEAQPQRVYASRNNQKQVVELDAQILDKLPSDIGDWRDKRLVRFDAPEVQKIQIETPEGRMAAVRSTEDSQEWMLTEPEDTLADGDRIRALLLDLQNAEVSKFLNAEEIEAASPAFNSPLVALTLWEENDEAPKVVLLARRNESPEVYARLEGGEVFSVAPKILNQLNVDPSEMKDRSVIRFKASDIRKMEITSGGDRFEINREGVKWDVPGGLEMEPYEIDELLWDLQSLKYTAVMPRQRDDRLYGFDSPGLIIRLWGEEEDNAERIIIGKKISEGNRYYVLGGDEGEVMEVEDALISKWLEKF